MRIGILTFHRAYNCGAMLQAFALSVVLKRMGHEVAFPVTNHVGEGHRFFVQDVPQGRHGVEWIKSFLGRLYYDLTFRRCRVSSASAYDCFRRANLPEVRCRPADFARKFDCLVVGSDQVWAARHAGDALPLFLGEELPDQLPRISYAASAGDDPMTDETWARVEKAVRRFAAVSVREQVLADRLRSVRTAPVACVLDPTLLLTARDYEKVADGDVPRGRYLYLYTLAPTDYELDLARGLAQHLGVGFFVSSVSQPAFVKAVVNGIDYSVGPARMLNLIRHAEYVVASSFHGTALALVMGKKFVSVVGRKDVKSTRVGTLLGPLGLAERIVVPGEAIDCVDRKIRSEIDGEAFSRLDGLRESSVNWLSGALMGIRR